MSSDDERREGDGTAPDVAQLLHDLRTPLTAVVGFAQLALERVRGDAELTELVETILNSGRAMEAHLAQLCEAPGAGAVR